MNEDKVFVKTSDGELAVTERTRLVQRNLRMVLVLVNGIDDVKALQGQIGDSALVSKALSELESMGLIREDERGGSAATSKIHMSDSRPKHGGAKANDVEGLPELHEVAAEGNVDVGPMSQFEPLSEMQAEHRAMIAERQQRGAGEERKAQHAGNPMMASIRAWFRSKKQRKLEAEEEAMFEKAYSEPDESVVATAPMTAGKAIAPAGKPVSRVSKIEPKADLPKPRQKIKWGRLILVVLLVVLGALIAAILLRPYDEYKPVFEQRLASILDEPVKIEKLEVQFYPMPLIRLSNIQVGGPVYASVAEIALTPDPRMMLGSQAKFNGIQINRLQLSAAGLHRLGRWFKPGKLQGVKTGKITFADASLTMGKGAISGLAGTVEADDQKGLEKLVVEASNGTLQTDLKPVEGGLSFALKASNWTLPIQPSLAVDVMEANGQIGAGVAEISTVQARAYEGVINGSGTIRWDDTSASAIGNFQCERLIMGRLLSSLDALQYLDGQAECKGSFSANAPSVNELDQSAKFDSTLTVAKGNLKRFDLAAMLRSASSRGGNTPFDSLMARVTADRQSVRFDGVKMVSGLMQSAGQAVFNRREKTVSGNATIELRGSASTVRASALITGPSNNPELRAGH